MIRQETPTRTARRIMLAAAMVAMCAYAESTVTDVTADKKVQANGTYKLLRDAQAEHGAVAYDNRGMRVMVVDLHDKVQLWEGGPYWATTNIGAENPEEQGLDQCGQRPRAGA